MAEPTISCPRPDEPDQTVLLAHGEGGRASRRLLEEVVLAELGPVGPEALDDAACLGSADGELLTTTDAFVVTPLFFPGGDIGSLAVHGTVNDLAVCGAEPRWLAVSLILEEGLPFEQFRRVLRSVRRAAEDCGVTIMAGDTKVVGRGQCDQMFIIVTGVGTRRPGLRLSLSAVRPGDAILVSGPIAEHGMAVLVAREQLMLEGELRSDSAPVHHAVKHLLDACPEVHFLRDPTRGGVAAVLHEVAEATGWTLVVDEAAVPVSPPVRAACELLGLDPLHVACEGRFVAFVPEELAEQAVRALRDSGHAPQAACVGRVEDRGRAEVLVRTLLGLERVLDEPSGSPLPRIC